MGAIYAWTDDGREFLVEIECDGCDKTAKPGSRELLEEWRKDGVTDFSRGGTTTWYYCGDCKHSHSHGSVRY